MFRDKNDNVVMIEVRGVRTETGILFRAKHISVYLGMENLLDTLQNEYTSYIKCTHWIKLYEYSSGVVTDLLSRSYTDNKSVDDSEASSGLVLPTEKPKSKKIYLTLAGLLKVIFCSTSANENVIILRDWVIRLVFVHKFGSYTERIDLAETLTPYKKCLTNLSGIIMDS